MHGTDCEIHFSHLIGKPFHFTFAIAENDGLSDGQSIIKITEGIKFPFFFFNSHKKLFDPV